jgi:hypothetical protein
MLVGEALCAFAGDLAFAGEIGATMEGTIDGSDIEGVVMVAIPSFGDYEVPWTGSYSTDQITSDEDGTLDVFGFEVAYTLAMEADRL